MASTFLSCSKRPPWRFQLNPSGRRKCGYNVRKVVISARSPDNYDGRLVDENMIVLRIRKKEMKMLENPQQPQANWTEWEKKYFPHFDQDVCEVIGLLQTFLMNTRPCLALGMLAVVALSLPISTYVVMHNSMVAAKDLLSMFSTFWLR